MGTGHGFTGIICRIGIGSRHRLILGGLVLGHFRPGNEGRPIKEDSGFEC